jgi:outer membrane immunogenic protein
MCTAKRPDRRAKNRRRRCSVAALCLAFGSHSLFAQDQDWTGAYVAGTLGHALQPDDDDEIIEFDTNLDGAFGEPVNTAAPANAFSPGFCGGNSEGLSPGECPDDEGASDFGLRAGYDWEMGTWVIGGVGDLSFSNVEDSVSAFSIAPGRYTMTRELNWVVAARLRGGYVLRDNLLIYGTGGIAWADMDHTLSSTDTQSTFTERGDDQVTGFQLGIGVEMNIGRNWRVAGEFLHTNLNDDDYRARASGAPPNPFVLVNPAGTDLRRTEDRFNLNSFRATFSYKFGDL